MRLNVDLDLRQVITSLGVRQVASSLFLTRGDSLDLEIQFSRNGVVVDPGAPDLFFCVKTVGNYDGTPLALCTSFAKVGTGESAYWVGNPDLNTVELNTALGVGEGADLASITANCEIGYTLASRQTTTRALTCVIENDLYRGSEATPSSAGTLTLVGGQHITLTASGPTNLTLPTSGKLATLDSNDKLLSAQLPDAIDLRVSVLGGTTAELRAANLREDEIAVNTETKRIVYGDGLGGVTDPTVDSCRILSQIGDLLIKSLQAVLPANSGTLHFATTKATAGTFSITTSTGYARLINADGSLGTQVGSGDSGSSLTLSIPAGGSHRALGAISVANGGSVRSGDITTLRLSSNQLTSFSSAGLSALTALGLSSNQLTSFSSAGLSALTHLDLSSNQLTSFSSAGLSALTDLRLTSNQLTSFSSAGLSALTTLYISSNQLDATALDTGYSELGTAVGSSKQIDVTGNPGVSGDSPYLATDKGWTVVGS